ncbi:MAG TPA: phosphoribosylformylglycinamidine cyclo-ligase [Clostridiales bacterium]|jgi:phosphoribosylformylglycinamidine cyclo-ligase|nr:phosphoribosylformylglycinamidine cyclo-ligase [Clostridiales bacterium]
MIRSHSDSYKKAGVDIEEGYRAVELMKRHIARTTIPGAEQDIGGFGGLFVPDLAGIAEPVLVSGTDGVGTKLKLAFLMDRHDTIGIDCVAMCVNDVICSGARPLFFLDYIALGRSVAEKVADIVSGIAEGCVQAGCALIGGETAEMPGFYKDGEYDVAGFAVGLVDRSKILDKTRVQAGDILLGLPSSGIHSNGFSLVRKALDLERADLFAPVPALEYRPLGDVLLEPTRIYVQPVLALLEEVPVRSIAHITGGGFYENIPRSLPAGLSARIDRSAFDVPPVFDLIARAGSIPERDMFNTFNMGIGMTITVPAAQAAEAVRILNGQNPETRTETRIEARIEARIIGEIVPGDEGVIL